MNGKPAYQRIADDLRAEITSGALAPGAPVPGVTALADKYGVTRVTSRNALRELAQQGLTVDGLVASHQWITVPLARKGNGWAGESPTSGADSWASAILAAGRVPSQRIDVLIGNAIGEAAGRLGGEPGRAVPAIVRRLTRYADNEPHNRITFWFPHHIAQGTPIAEPDSIAEGSIAWLETKLGPLDHQDPVISARMPSPEEAEILRIPQGQPVLEVWRTSTADGGPVAVSRAIYPGDRTKIAG